MFLSAAYWLWHSAGLAGIASITPADYAELLGQVNRYAGVITKYYLFILGLVFFIAACFLVKPPARERLGSGVGWAATAALLVCVPLLIVYTNLRVVQADVTFKLADGFNQPGAYPVAIRIYDRANQLAPNEDYYYLYLGRAYLNQARSLTDLAEQDSLLSQAALDLKTAQAINPLNSDHTANLARLYSLWASLNQDDLDRQERAVAADEYFSRALVLSPNNVRLWNEWAYLKLKIQQQPEIASQYLDQALQIDPSYDWTYGQLGDVAIYQAALETDLAKKQTLLDQAAANFREALVKSGDRVSKFNYALSLGGILAETTRFQEAAAAYRQALEFYPESATAWRVYELLAQVYNQLGDSQQTVDALNQALSLAPEDQKTRLQTLLQQLQTPP
jgi:tetratricopeptide (TPR) repeat protein